jgi:hypothetical protein
LRFTYSAPLQYEPLCVEFSCKQHEESVRCLFFAYDGHTFPFRMLRRRW